MKKQLELFAWSDTKVNFMLGTWPGIQSRNAFASEIERKNKKKTEMRTYPYIANIYNDNMGGIDLHDSHRSRISTQLTSKKWWTPLFYGCLDISIVNSCINWREVNSTNMTFHAFVISIINDLQPPVGWWQKGPSSAEKKIEYKPKRIPIVNPEVVHSPFVVKRTAKIDTRKNCAICYKKTNMGCESCNSFVCFGSCWKKYHN